MPEIKLKDVPEDVLRIILLIQADVKFERAIGQFSMEQTIYKIIREYDKIKKEQKEKS